MICNTLLSSYMRICQKWSFQWRDILYYYSASAFHYIAILDPFIQQLPFVHRRSSSCWQIRWETRICLQRHDSVFYTTYQSFLHWTGGIKVTRCPINHLSRLSSKKVKQSVTSCISLGSGQLFGQMKSALKMSPPALENCDGHLSLFSAILKDNTVRRWTLLLRFGSSRPRAHFFTSPKTYWTIFYRLNTWWRFLILREPLLNTILDWFPISLVCFRKWRSSSVSAARDHSRFLYPLLYKVAVIVVDRTFYTTPALPKS